MDTLKNTQGGQKLFTDISELIEKSKSSIAQTANTKRR